MGYSTQHFLQKRARVRWRLEKLTKFVVEISGSIKISEAVTHEGSSLLPQMLLVLKVLRNSCAFLLLEKD